MSGLRRLRDNRGDTIVEVILVVAMLGVTFAGAYSIAFASVNKNRNSQEHAEALQYISSQIELLHNATPGVIDEVTSSNQEFCFSDAGALVRPVNPAICNKGDDSRYAVRIRYQRPPTDSGIYRLQVTWQGAGDLGMQSERIVYRQYPL